MRVTSQRLDRRQKEDIVWLADVATGHATKVHEERDPTWVEVQDDPVWLDGGSKFLWLSEADGFNRIHTLPRTGGTPTPISPAALLAGAAAELSEVAQSHAQTLLCESLPDVPALHGDPRMLHRTLVNLIGNALKFTPHGGAITVSARGEPGAVVFAVRDTGEGIPADAFARIFDKFGQVAHDQARYSTGLGLTFCRMAVEAHGGQIWVESELGQGSTFFFRIPLGLGPHSAASPA